MGICLCKCKEEEQSVNTTNNDRRRRTSSANIQADDQTDWYPVPGNGSNWWKSVPSKVVDNLVLDTLNVIGTLVEK